MDKIKKTNMNIKKNNHCHVDHINLHWQYKRTRNEN